MRYLNRLPLLLIMNHHKTNPPPRGRVLILFSWKIRVIDNDIPHSDL